MVTFISQERQFGSRRTLSKNGCTHSSTCKHHTMSVSLHSTAHIATLAPPPTPTVAHSPPPPTTHHRFSEYCSSRNTRSAASGGLRLWKTCTPFNDRQRACQRHPSPCCRRPKHSTTPVAATPPTRRNRTLCRVGLDLGKFELCVVRALALVPTLTRASMVEMTG